MTARSDAFQERYARALEDYLRRRNEAELHHGYNLGRTALADGLGLLDALAAHERALEAIVAIQPDGLRSLIERASWPFFREVLSSYEMTLHGYRAANGELVRVNAELESKNLAVLAMNEELEAFAYSVSHDLRAPLRGIDAFIEMAIEDADGTLCDNARRHLARARESAQHMSQLIGALLDLAKVSGIEMLRSVIDLSHVAQRVVDRLRAAEPIRHVEVAIEPDMRALGDGRLIEIALANLIGNAWKFTARHANARIAIGSRAEATRRVYFVSDNGAGFDPAHASKLFGVFQRLHPANEFDGTGIGLAIVQRIVRRHGGAIWAIGEVGRGATFSFTLGTSELDE